MLNKKQQINQNKYKWNQNPKILENFKQAYLTIKKKKKKSKPSIKKKTLLIRNKTQNTWAYQGGMVVCFWGRDDPTPLCIDTHTN